jgi:hypothetical protein
MIQFNRPENLNGEKLVNELEAAGVEVKANTVGIKCPVVEYDFLYLDIKESDKLIAQEIISAHNGTALGGN